MTNFLFLPFVFLLHSCSGYRTKVNSSVSKPEGFQIPYFKDEESLSRELGLLRLRTVESEQEVSVLAELTAGYTLKAMMEEGSDNTRSLELARQFGIRCLRTASGFESLLQSRGLRVTPKAVAVLDESPELKHCRQWTGISWSLWLLNRGVKGAAIDTKSVQALAPKKPKSSFDHYQHALRLALDLDDANSDEIQEALSTAAEKSVIPHRMYFEMWRLGGTQDTSAWTKAMEDIDFSQLNQVDAASIRRVFPDAQRD